MITRLFLVALALIAFTMMGCQSPQSNASSEAARNTNTSAAGKYDPKVVEDLKELLAKHDKALGEKNIDDVLSTFSTDENTVLLGTGEGERFVGAGSIKEAYTQMFKDYDAGSLQVTCDWKTGGVDPAGVSAWLAATCPASDSLKGVKRDYFLNVSAAAVKGANGWRFAMLHMSNGTDDPGPPPTGNGGQANRSNDGTNANSARKIEREREE